MKNLTKVTSFLLIGLSDHPPTINILFVVFLLIYLMTIVINPAIIYLVFTDSHLHNPMYFFLGNLAFLDMCYSSVTAPKMLYDLVSNNRSITIPACTMQIFFFIYFALVWVLGFLYSLVHTLFSLRLTFCGPNTIHNFFCDLPHLFQISCTDTFINILVILLVGGSLGLGAFAITFLPYVGIFSAVLRMETNTCMLKAFST
uniref:G-protein coupled receptors family 1 profile domain-containing protein n=1 Tax=Pyxicephalus adspersus TaxID=30357 RepID=A0AAV2ZKH2_PYXAD|nr:TPA: hypothetical protein GDO54_016677 [Pyxicephalus adspersus]